MKVYCINILLFAVPLNILVSSPQKNPSITQNTTSNRILCECEFYAPANYDNDPQMKEVMENFNKQTEERFNEYDERMKSTRQKCKDKCDKEIQKIILKDKLEKELTEKFATLQTDIKSDAIPTCVCEKSMANKMEKRCLKCTQNLGGIVAPSSGVLAGIAEGALYAWKTTTIDVATKAAIATGEAAGIEAGIEVAIQGLNAKLNITSLGGLPLQEVISTKIFNHPTLLGQVIQIDYIKMCGTSGANPDSGICIFESLGDSGAAKAIAQHARTIAESAGLKAKQVSATVTTTETEVNASIIEITASSYNIAIIASVVAIVVIVLIMVIIYLILRYRRKKKMKKKLQYIKLLEE
ncbi:rifin [Plasmodium reichenowi]|uniref:Rifin n=1 Tax=Plasmodium reichenowi TaxID=5854 RepID=A0A060RQR9_PLARE|nr:rifin [Plasmodium reichenowi]